MATHGRTGLGHLLHGSVAETVLAESEVPVFLVQVCWGRTREARAYLEGVARRLRQEDSDLQVSVDVRLGEPDTGITAAATDRVVDLIIMATHGCTGLRRLTMGSVAGNVLRKRKHAAGPGSASHAPPASAVCKYRCPARSRSPENGNTLEPLVPEPLRTRLLRIGYIKLAAPGLLHRHRYVRADRIARVREGRVELMVRAKSTNYSAWGWREFPWKQWDVQIVIESTGHFTDATKVQGPPGFPTPRAPPMAWHRWPESCSIASASSADY